MNDGDNYLTPSEAAAILGVSPKVVRELANRGVLHCVRTPLGRLFPIALVLDYAKGHGISTLDASR